MSRYGIILAAGKGTRMKSTLPKVCHKVAGEPMAQYVVDALENIGVDKIFMVVGHGADVVMKEIKGNVEFIYQDEQKGTGHAIQQVAPHLKGMEGTTVVLMGDAPLIQEETLRGFIEKHEESKAKGTVLSTIQRPPTGYGRIVRTSLDTISQIVEEKDTFGTLKDIDEVNTGVMVFDNKMLFDSIFELKTENAQKEYYLTDMVSLFAEKNIPFQAYLDENSQQFLGVNDRVQLSVAEKEMRRRINEEMMRNGVTLIDPETTFIEKQVKVGADTVIYPNVVLKGQTIIGEGCIIESGSLISDSLIGDKSIIKHSYIQESKVGNAVIIGPFAQLRPETVLEDEVKIGNFVEVKKSVLKKGSKVNHLSYIGDADVGAGVNVGCGTITVNYDGSKKHKTIIEDGAFIGCNSNLIAPVKIGENALVAAGTTVTEDVPKNALAIGRSRQTNKEGYVKKK